MNEPTRIVEAGNILAPALAEIIAAGYKVTIDGASWRATSQEVVLAASDPLALLGLVKLYEVRGPAWNPSDHEVEALLELDAKQPAVSERTDVWAESGAVHILCVTSHGDPVKMTDHEAYAFASRLAEAIKAAS